MYVCVYVCVCVCVGLEASGTERRLWLNTPSHEKKN